ncbi:MAG: STAS domain-containing protein [Phycisphaerae bacterium]|nr:STAS domain-containing protein [Phycisphaerae bacterium]
MSRADELVVVEQTDNGACIARLVPSNVLDELQITGIGRQLTDLVDQGARRLVVDFSRVDHLSSSALGMLITVRQGLSQVKGDMRLCNIRPEIYEVFKITGLDKLFVIQPTVTEALASLR